MFRILGKITHFKVLAVLFIIAIFYVGSATFPSTIKTVGRYLTDDRADFLSTKEKINVSYRKMLDFEHSNFKNKGSYVNLNGLMAHIMGQRYMNKRVKLDNGHLTYIFKKRNATRSAAQMTKLYNKQKEKGKDFLFVLAPIQVPKYEDLLPAGYTDYSNQNADDLLGMLDENGVPTLDLREAMRNDGIDHSNAFFVTDHHWKMETGFWAYTKIIERLEEAGEMDPIASMYTDLDEYEIEVYKDYFLGSHGKRTGSYFAGVDDFSIINPKFETDMSLEISSIGLNKQGRFADLSFDYSKLRLDYFSSNPYGAFSYGNRDMKNYRNSRAPVDLKIMTIGDSFSRVPFAFLTLVFGTCDQLDMRHYKGDFEEYYSKYDPDVVIVLINPSQIPGKSLTYDYFNDLQNTDTVPDEPDDTGEGDEEGEEEGDL